MNSPEKIVVVGLGYVGLPLCVVLSEHFSDVIGFDIDRDKIAKLLQGVDPTDEIGSDRLKRAKLRFTSNIDECRDRTFFIIAVPTPVDIDHRPDLHPISSASELVGKVLGKGSVVVYESTVYPGLTEEICIPILEKHSKLKCPADFGVGYSPERINPGDKEHTLETITKVVSAINSATLNRVEAVYSKVTKAGLFKAASIKVAEAAKVIENTQRDLNIALMNELAIIFEKLNIRTYDVLTAAKTKWNFLPFQPGLVGGHCIGVDPYYLTTKAEHLGYQPEVILAGRRINDNMGRYIAQRVVKTMINSGASIKNAKVAIYGVTFKENVADLRNSRVPDIYNELKEFGITALVTDPCCASKDVEHEYGIKLTDWGECVELDALILAVSHKQLLASLDSISGRLKSGGVLADIKSVMAARSIPNNISYWCL